MIHCPHCGQPAGSHEPASMVDPASGEADGLSYRDLFEANRAVMLLIDPDSERIVDANPAAVSFYGYPENVLKGMKITDINTLPPDSTRKRIKKAQKAAQTIFRFQHRLASGGIRTVEVFSSPIQINRRTMLFSIIHDSSEEVNAQKAQKATESLLHSVFDSSPDLMLLIDRDLRIVLSNWKGREFVPLSKRGHRPRCHQVFMNRQTPCDPCLALEVFKTGAPKIYERFNPNPAVGHIEVHAYPVLDDRGNVALVAEHVRDINNRKAAEREKAVLRSKLYQAQRMESIGTLAGGIAHDFNNILMAILGNVSLMKAEIQTGSAVTESLDHLEDYVRRGSELTRQLLGFARGGKYEVKPSNLGDILAKSTDMFGRTRKDIRIDVEQAPDVVSVDIDRGQIDQVFLNILLNAGQAMPDGGDIFVRIRNVDLNDAYGAPYGVVPGTYARVSITDTGIGMDEKTKDRIFDPFFTTKGIGEGTGLGLASAYGIVKNHGGIINVYSEPGQGSTFTVYLPAGSKDGHREQERPATAATIDGLTILVVDDEEMVLDTTSRMLTRAGCSILTAKGGEQAIEIYKTNRNAIDLVILDMIMPAMGGGEVFDRLREMNPRARVILSSGYSINGQASCILERGCDGFLQKPFSASTLTSKIRSVMDKA